MKKALFIVPLISLFCFSCQKSEVQSDSGMTAGQAVSTTYSVGVTMQENTRTGVHI